MSIYKEPPPGMFVVPDPQDMTKVKKKKKGKRPAWRDIHTMIHLLVAFNTCSSTLIHAVAECVYAVNTVKGYSV